MPASSKPAPTGALLLLASLWLAACSTKTPAGIVVEDPIAPTDPYRNLHLSIPEPAGDLAVRPGGAATVWISASDRLGAATVRIVADADGDPATTADQHEIGTTIATPDGTPRALAVVLPAAMPLGAFAILGALDEQGRSLARARAPGRLLVDETRSLTLQQPATDTAVSRGGHLRIEFAVTDRSGSADLRFVADADGNVDTTADQHALAATTTALATPQSLTVGLGGVPLGTYRILGIASGAGSPDVVATAAGSVAVADVAFAAQDGGPDHEEGRAIAVAADSSVVVAGRYAGSSLFGEWPTFTGLDAAGGDDVFLARYSGVGALQWAVSAGGPSGDCANAVAVFPDGSILVGGRCSGLASFGGAPVASAVSSNGEDDAFLARYTANGMLSWVCRAGGVFHDEVTGVAVLPDGGFIATGRFAAEGSFGEGAAAVQLTVAGSLLTSDGFVARYDGDGSLAWIERFGGAAGDDQGVGVAAAADGSFVVTGTFVDAATFGEGANQVTLTSAGGTDVFFARYDAAGNLLWAQRGGGSGEDSARGITALPTGECVACGSYFGIASFGAAADLGTLQSVGLRDAYVARFTATGGLSWVRSAGGANDDDARALAVDGHGAVTVTGSFHTFATFGVSPATRNLTAFGLRDVFVARYDASGDLLWAKRAGGTDHDLGCAVAVLRDGSCAVAGTFQVDATFGEGGGGVRVLSANGPGDVFVARFNADGDF